MKSASIMSLAVLAIFILHSSDKSVSGSPIKFMCDMCESNFLHCLMKCHMEEYMTRHMYNQ